MPLLPQAVHHCGHDLRGQPYPAPQMAHGVPSSLCIQKGHERSPASQNARSELYRPWTGFERPARTSGASGSSTNMSGWATLSGFCRHRRLLVRRDRHQTSSGLIRNGELQIGLGHFDDDVPTVLRRHHKHRVVAACPSWAILLPISDPGEVESLARLPGHLMYGYATTRPSGIGSSDPERLSSDFRPDETVVTNCFTCIIGASVHSEFCTH